MKSRKLKAVFLLSSLSVTLASAWASEYIVKKGDSLSGVAHHTIPGRVWGKDGSLEKLLAMNATIKNEDLIFAGQVLNIPDHELAQTEKSQTREVASESDSKSDVIKSDPTNSVSQKESTEPAEFEEHSGLSVTPIFSFSRISATDRTNGSQATLGSALNVGAQIGWRQYWSPEFQSALLMSAMSNSYSTTSASRSLDHSSFLLGTIDLEGRFGKVGSLQWFAHLGAIQTPFVRGESTSANTLDVVSTPDVGLGFSVPMFHSKIFNMSFEGEGSYLTPSTQSSYTVNSGYEVVGRLLLAQHSKKNMNQLIEGGLFFKYANQGTSITSQNVMQLGASLQFNFDLFTDKSK